MKKLLTYVICPLIIIGLAYLIVNSIMEPVKFNKERTAREADAITLLKDIRTLQVAFKSANGRFSPCVDSLKMFYESGKMDISGCSIRRSCFPALRNRYRPGWADRSRCR